MSLIESHLLSSGFSQENINEILNTEQEKLYKIFSVKQKEKIRVIEEPIDLLKKIQKALISLFSTIELHPSCMARKGKGIIDNASLHFNALNILKVDIKHCYSSITIEHLTNALMLSNKSLFFLEDLDKIAKLCFIQKDNKLVLPTGAPISSLLCNIALLPIDLEVQQLANRYDYIYSRYIDDMILSNKTKERHWDIKKQIEEILKLHSLTPNFKKSRWSKSNEKMIVTGVRLNGNDRVPKSFSRLLRAKLQNLAKEKKEIDQETKGCLAYVKSIDIKKYEDFLKYFERRKAYVPTR